MNWRAYLADPALREFAAVEEGGRRILARRGFEEWAASITVESCEAGAERTIGGGRAEHPVVPLADGGSAVLRRYRRGGLMRHLNRDRYFLGHRAFEEVRATMRAGRAGVSVPQVLAAAEWRRGVGYGALLATRWLSDTVGLDRWMAERRGAASLPALRAAGKQIARLHAGGIAHPDLNLRNLLVSVAPEQPDPTLYLIDFDRARLMRRSVPPRRRARELERLARSARKLGLPLSDEAWSALREGYGGDWPLLAPRG